MNLTEAKGLRHREALIHTPSGSRWFVNGAVKTWKTRPNEVKVPLKHGLYDYGYLTDQNMRDYIKE